jgi:hypothetical protein
MSFFPGPLITAKRNRVPVLFLQEGVIKSGSYTGPFINSWEVVTIGSGR